MNELDLSRTMAPQTAVSKAEEALSCPEGANLDSVASLAGAIMIREGLIAVARAIAAGDGDVPDMD